MKIFYTLLCLLVGSWGLLAQTSFTAENADVCPGAEVIVPVTVTGYNNVQGFQFAVLFDAALLAFQSVDEVALNGNVVSFSPAAGELRLLYTGSAQSINNGDTAFNLRFTTTATTGTTGIDLTAITTAPQFPALVNSGGTSITPTLIDGTVTFGDSTPPVLATCPPDVSVTAASGAGSATVPLTAPTATDNCTTVSVSDDGPIGGNFPVGTTTVTYTATDGSGNTATCQTTVTVDPAAPADTLKFILSDESAGCVSTQATLAVTVQNYSDITGWQLSANWDPSQATYVSSAGTAALSGSLDLNEDDVASGRLNATYFDFGAIVSGSGAAIPDDVVIFTVTLDYSGTGGVLPVTFGPVNNTIEVTTQNGTLGPNDFQRIDGSITGQSNGPPVLAGCSTGIQVNTAPDACGAVVTFATPTATDDCDPNPTVQQTAGPTSGSVFPLGTSTVAFVATDNSGQTATCSFDVVVTDNVAPVISCPADITLSTLAGVCDVVANFPLPTVTDNCAVDTLTTSITSGAVLSVGVTTVTATATDESGNTATCSFTITVEDNEAPIVSGPVCGTAITVNAGPDSCSAIVVWQAPTASDNCQVLVFSSTHQPGDEFPVGTTTVTYGATDGNQNSSACSFTITVLDDQAPTLDACPADITAQPSGTNCEATVSWTAPTFSDNCGLLSVTESMASPATLTAGTYTVDYVATDSSNNVTTCSFVIFVPGSTGFTFGNCPTSVGGTVQPGSCMGFATWNEPVFNPCYNGTMPTITSDFQPGDSFPAGVTTVTYTADDGMGNTTTCSFDVTITDNEPPVLSTCPADLNVTLTNACDTVLTWSVPTVSDNCDASPSLSSNFQSGDTFAAGNYTVTYTATDAGGNTATCSFAVSVSAPSQLTYQNCPAPIAVNNDPDTCGAVVSWTPPTLQPNCGGGTPVISSTHQPGDFFPVGNELVIYTAIDGLDTARCEFLITVADVEPILITCPADIQVVAAPGAGTAPVIVPAPVIDNNCGGVNLTNDYNNTTNASDDYPLGTTTVSFVATDDNGQTALCSFDVEVVATGILAISCPGNQTVTAPAGSCAAVVDNINVTVTDTNQVAEIFYAIDGTITAAADASGATFTAGTSTVAYAVVSTGGDTLTCDFAVTVNGNNPPTFDTCPADQTLNGGGATCTAVATYDAPAFSGGCSTVTLAGPTIASGSDFAIGTTPVSYYLVENGDTVATCTFNITVNATAAPAFDTCPTDLTVGTDTGQCGAVVTFDDPTFSGGCGSVTLLGPSVPSGSFFAAGSTTVDYYLVENGDTVAICSFVVSVEDNEEPVFDNCPTTTTIIDLAADACTATLGLTPPTASDNCGVVSFSTNIPLDTMLAAGNYIITYTISDAAGNTASCVEGVQVRDVTAPAVVSAPADVTVSADADACGAFVAFADPTYTDACGSVLVTCSPASGSFFPVGNNPVTCTATDASGNTQVTTFMITVADEESPTVMCPADVILAVDGTIINDPDGSVVTAQNVGCDEVMIEYSLPAVADNCGTPSILGDPANPASGSTLTPGTYSLTFEVVDQAGNSVSCTYALTVMADQGPAITPNDPDGYCAGDPVTLCADPSQGAAYAWSDPQGALVSTEQCYDIVAVTTAQAGTYTLSVTLANGCSYTNTYDLSVGALPVATVTINDVLCTDGDQDLELTATIDNGVTIADYTWTGPANFSATVAAPVIENATAANAGIYTLVLTTDAGCTATFTEEVQVSGTPAPPTVQATDQFVCTNGSTVLSGTSYSGSNVTYVWSADPAAGAGLPANTNNFVLQVQPTAPGDYTYSFFADVNGCITPVSNVTVNVQDDPTVAISVAGDTDCVDGSGSVVLTETGGDGVTWTWTGPTGMVLSNEQTLELTNVTAADAGAYTVQVQTANGCVNSMSENLVINEAPDALTFTVADQGFCLGGSTQLFFTPYPTASTVVYTITGLGDSPITWFDPTFQFQPPATGFYTITVTAVVDGCPTGTLFETIEVQDAPALDLEFLGNTDCVAPDGSVQLTDVTGDAATYTWTYPDGTTESGQTITLNGSAQFGGTYNVVAASTLGCQSSASISAEVITAAVPPVSIATTIQPCEDEPFDLLAQTDANNVIFQWSGPNDFSTTGQRVTISNPTDLNSGDYQVTAVNPATGCSTTSAVQAVSVLEVPVTNDYFIARQIGVDMTQPFLVTDNDVIAPGAGYTVEVIKDVEFGELTLTDPAKGEFVYTYNGTRAVTDNFIYRLCYDDCKEACDMAVATIDTRYNDEECVTTDVMSPNGDGINDRFMIYCLESTTLPRNELLVFNTWGDEVFRAAPYDNTWEGTYGNEELPDGTYYYLFRRNSSEEYTKGYFTIYR